MHVKGVGFVYTLDEVCERRLAFVRREALAGPVPERDWLIRRH
jgi:hypothetical protein